MILAVHSFPGANECVSRHFPYWQKAGFSRIIGVGTIEGGCQWPEGMESVNIGSNTYISGDALPCRLISTVDYILSLPDWSSAAIIEYDTVIFKPIPEPTQQGLAMILAGGPQGGRKGKFFYHNPWVANRSTWMWVLESGCQMLAEGEFENGSPDCFIGWVAEKNCIPVIPDLFRSYSRNTIEDWNVQEATEAYRSGVNSIHGIKSKDILDKIIS